MKKILEVHISYEQGKLKEVAVLWDDNGKGVRGTYVDNRVKAGYLFLTDEMVLNDKLLQEIRGYGMYIDDKMKKKYFSHINKNKWTR